MFYHQHPFFAIFAFQFMPSLYLHLSNGPSWCPLFPVRTIRADPEAAALPGLSEQTLTPKYVFKVQSPVSI